MSEVLGVVESLGKFEVTRVGNNQTGNPMASPRILSVAMHRGPMFPKEGKVKGSQGQWVPPLVIPGVDAINTNST